jgi:Txe/YoeB family toxin of Txe-Axe toxin-antitoxin module
MYELVVLNKAKRDLERYKKKDKSLEKKVEKVFDRLSKDPFYIGLRIHKVRTKKNGRVYSTRLTGDLRIIWRFTDGKIILILTVGGHSGKHSVY